MEYPLHCHLPQILSIKTGNGRPTPLSSPLNDHAGFKTSLPLFNLRPWQMKWVVSHILMEQVCKFFICIAVENKGDIKNMPIPLRFSFYHQKPFWALFPNHFTFGFGIAPWKNKRNLSDGMQFFESASVKDNWDRSAKNPCRGFLNFDSIGSEYSFKIRCLNNS